MLNRDNGWDNEALIFSGLGVRLKIEKVVGALHHLYVTMASETRLNCAMSMGLVDHACAGIADGTLCSLLQNGRDFGPVIVIGMGKAMVRVSGCR